MTLRRKRKKPWYTRNSPIERAGDLPGPSSVCTSCILRRLLRGHHAVRLKAGRTTEGPSAIAVRDGWTEEPVEPTPRPKNEVTLHF